MLSQHPLVSIVVASYNSTSTIVETLESIKAQTYKNIELIITDDASRDDTVTVCKKWLAINGAFFVNSNILTSNLNTGISPNMNRGIRNSHGEWIKVVAADDRLMPNCIDSNVNFINENPDYGIVFSKVVGFGDEEAAKQCVWKDCSKIFNRFSTYKFKIVLYQQNFLPASSAFYKKETFDILGGYDESIPFLEDWPFWVKALSLGIKLGFNNDFTVEYRFSPQSISQQSIPNRNPKFVKSSELATQYALNHLAKLNIFSYVYIKSTYNRLRYNSLLWKLFHSINILNPFYYYNKIVMKEFNDLLLKT